MHALAKSVTFLCTQTDACIFLCDDDHLKQSFRLKTSRLILRHRRLYNSKPHHLLGLIHHVGFVPWWLLPLVISFPIFFTCYGFSLDVQYVVSKNGLVPVLFFTDHKFLLHKWHPQGTSAFFPSLPLGFLSSSPQTQRTWHSLHSLKQPARLTVACVAGVWNWRDREF